MSNLSWSGNSDQGGRPAKSLRFKKRRNFRLPCSLLIVGALALLFWLVPTPNNSLDIYRLQGLTTLTPAPTPTASPRPTSEHGGRILFTCTRGEYNQICLINADGTGYEQLIETNSNAYYPTYSPQGDVIVYASNRNGSFDLYMLIPENRKQFQLTEEIGNAFSPDFSPDGQQIIFLNRAADGPSSLWIMQRMGENPHLLYAGPNTIVSAAWAPDGKTIAFAMSVDQPNAYEIFLLDAQNPKSAPRRISHELQGIGGSINWSPDSKDLVIYAGLPGDKNIYRLEIASGQTTQLTSGGNNAAPSYSPDGFWIAYNSTRNDDQADIFIMRFDGHSTRQVTHDPEPDWQPRWQP
jgi:Tol biopolymer transport system component